MGDGKSTVTKIRDLAHDAVCIEKELQERKIKLAANDFVEKNRQHETLAAQSPQKVMDKIHQLKCHLAEPLVRWHFAHPLTLKICLPLRLYCHLPRPIASLKCGGAWERTQFLLYVSGRLFSPSSGASLGVLGALVFFLYGVAQALGGSDRLVLQFC